MDRSVADGRVRFVSKAGVALVMLVFLLAMDDTSEFGIVMIDRGLRS